MKRNYRTYLVLVAGLMLAPVASAQDVAAEKTKPVTTEGSSRFGFNVGYVGIQEIDGGTMGVGVSGDYAVADNFLVGGTLDYWQEEYETKGLDGEVSDVALGVNAKLIFTDVRAPFRPYLMAGVAGHRFEAKSQQPLEGEDPKIDPNTEKVTDVEGEAGVDIGGGLLYRVRPELDVSAQVLYRNILKESVDFDQVAVAGGLAYML